MSTEFRNDAVHKDECDDLNPGINPGEEEASWQRFHEEGIDRFLNKTFVGEYQQALVTEFETYLPEQPPWPVTDDVPNSP